MKYICFDHAEYHIFSPWCSHIDEAKLRPHKKVTSAGRVRLKNGQFECFDESTTLNMKPAAHDTQRINAFMRGYE